MSAHNRANRLWAHVQPHGKPVIPHHTSAEGSKNVSKTPLAPKDPILDIERARSKPFFNVRELTYFLDGSEEVTNVKEMVASTIAEDPVLIDQNRYDLSRPEARKRTMAKIVQNINMIRERNADLNASLTEEEHKKQMAEQPNSDEDRANSRAGVGKSFEDAYYSILGALDPSWSIRIGVHYGLWASALNGSGSEEQRAEWRVSTQEMRVIGCFGMTEMGHGSNVQGLETTATYDPSTQEFIVHTPTITATKIWIGLAGETATHCAVFARLIIKEVDYGIHTFIVPIRDLKTGQVEPNVSVGDMGNKMGRNGLDNGWIQFHHKRIPLKNLLMRWNKVLPDGTYVSNLSTTNKSINYNALIGTRIELFNLCSEVLKKALTISIRYAAVRRQFLPPAVTGDKDENNTLLGVKPNASNKSASSASSTSTNGSGVVLEQQLLDYQTHQHRLFPILATCFALHFTSRVISTQTNKIMSNSTNLEANLNYLPELHATSSGLKSVGTWYVNDAIESCRQALGGLGYSLYSGLATLRNDWAVMCTWEGDNTVLSLQCARFIVKQWFSLQQQKRGSYITSSGILSYLSRDFFPRFSGGKSDFADTRKLLIALQLRAKQKIQTVATNIQNVMKNNPNNLTFSEIFASYSIDLLQMTKAHCYVFMYECFLNSLLPLKNVEEGSSDKAAVCKQLYTILSQLLQLFALVHIEEHLGDFLAFSTGPYFTQEQVHHLRDAIKDLLKNIRPHAVSLVDAFNIPDFVIDSPLGRYDGDVYNQLFHVINTAPGARGIPAYFDELIKPLTDPDYKKKE